MRRADAIPYIRFCLDDALAERDIKDVLHNARLVGWQCGFEPLFVAVWSYLGNTLDDDEAEEIATDFLVERGWFARSERSREPDYIL